MHRTGAPGFPYPNRISWSWKVRKLYPSFPACRKRYQNTLWPHYLIAHCAYLESRIAQKTALPYQGILYPSTGQLIVQYQARSTNYQWIIASYQRTSLENPQKETLNITKSDCIRTRCSYFAPSITQQQKAWVRYSERRWHNRNRWTVPDNLEERISIPILSREEGQLSSKGRNNNTLRTTLPARPPAIRANPMNNNNLALHTAFESPNPSSPRILSLSMILITR